MRELPKEQDEKDAQAIIDKDRDEKVIASILPFRDKVRRTAINERILTKINAVVRIVSRNSNSFFFYNT